MVFDFNIDEVFEIAEEIERNGARFYRNMAEQVLDKDIRNQFLHLAEMEDQHEKIFVSMRAGLSVKDKEPTVFDPDGESSLYLRALADLRVFDVEVREDFMDSETLSDDEKIEYIFRTAIGIEKESIAFYVGMKDLVPENLGKEKIEDIIREEMRHIRLLAKKLTDIRR
ncbi:MAG: ferritin family protein [Deltaproteobacteria bacterium]|nr:ferritin family protein [Deltaproteobacteria bacterium]